MKRLLPVILGVLVTATAWGANFSSVIGDKDGFGLNIQVGQPLPSSIDWDYCCQDFRDASEKSATDGSQQTDIYSAGVDAASLPASFTLTVPVNGTLTSAALSTFAAGLQQTTYTPMQVTVNGIADQTWLNHEDGETATAIHSLQLTSQMIAAANAAGQVTVTISQPTGLGATADYVMFDYFELDGVTSGGPAIVSLSPSSAAAGGAAFTLTVNGSNFVNGSVIEWNGVALNTTFVDGTQLTAAIPASDIATAGTATVTVVNPGGGGTSGPATFTVNTAVIPAPTVLSISPSSATAGGPAFPLTVNGSNFVNGSVIEWNGVALNTTFVNGTQLTAAIPASDIATAGTATVTVANPGGGGTSGAATFTINPANTPVPSIVSLSPASAAAGGPAFMLTVNGTNFVKGSVIEWNGADLNTTFLSGTQLTTFVPASDIATAGTATVTVANPAPGGGTSGPATFTINPAIPTGAPANFEPAITWVLPVNTTAGGPATTISVYGAWFVQGSALQWNGVNLPTTYVNGNQLQVSVPAADISTAGSATIVVVNPSSGGSSQQWLYPVTSPGVVTFPAGPQPVGMGPVAAAVDPASPGFSGRIYVVHRGLYRDICIDAADCPNWPTNVVTVVDQSSGGVIATIGIGSAVNGEGQGIAVDPASHHVFVTNANDNTVTMIDGTTNTAIATTQVDSGPEGIAVDPSARIVYVAGANVTLLSADTGVSIASVPVGGAALAIAVDSTSHLAYALVNSIPARIVAVNGKAQSAGTPIGLPPLIYTYKGIAVDPGSRVYVCDYNTGNVTPIDIGGATPNVLNGFASGVSYPEAIAVDPASHFVYVAGTANNAVSIDSSGTPQKTVATLRLPTGIVIDQSSGHAYVTDAESDSLSVVNTATLAAAGTIPLGVQPMGLALDTQSQKLYVANLIADSVSVVDAAARKPVANWTGGGYPWSVAVDSRLQQVYAVNSADGSVTIFNSADGSVKATLQAGAKGASVVKVNSATGMVYVSGGSAVTVIDGRKDQIAATIPTGNTPVGIAIDETANRVYVANQKDGTISVIDGAGNQVIATWQVPSGNGANNVWKLAIDPALRRLYVSIPPQFIGSFSGLQVLDTFTGASVAQVGGSWSSVAEDVAVNLNTHHVLLSDSGNGTVTVIDGVSHAILNTLVTGTAAVDLAVDPTAGLVYVSNSFDADIGVFSDQPAPPPAGTPPTPPGTPPPSVSTGGVVSAGSYNALQIAPGGIGAVFGANLAIGTNSAATLPLPTELGGISVLVNGYPAPLFFTSAGQINFQFPWEVLNETQVTIVILVNGVSSAPQTVNLPPAGPAIFQIGAQGQGAIQIAGTATLALPAGSIPGAQSRPALAGKDYITIYCTGLGDVTNRPADGAPALANPLSLTKVTPGVTIGGVPANVIFSGLTPGLYQIDVLVPSGAAAGNAVPVVVTIGGATSNTVTMAVQPAN